MSISTPFPILFWILSSAAAYHWGLAPVIGFQSVSDTSDTVSEALSASVSAGFAAG